jgi:DNA polymerase III epsilon subunit-like protein
VDINLDTKVNDVVEAFRVELQQQASCWSKSRTPSEIFDVEQGLQAVLNRLHTEIVGAVLEAIHRDRDFVTRCQHQAWQQCGVSSAGWRKVSVRTLGGNHVRLKTPYSTLLQPIERAGKSKKPYHQGHTCPLKAFRGIRSSQAPFRNSGMMGGSDSPIPDLQAQKRLSGQLCHQGQGIYPVLRRLGIVGRATPRLLAEVNRQMADGPSGTEVEERFASREIMLTQQPMRLYVRDFTGIALWQRRVAAADLDHATVMHPPPLAGKRVVVGLDGGRLRLRITHHGQPQAQTKSGMKDTCEPKLFAIYTIDHQGHKELKAQVTYDGTLQSAEYLFTLLKLRLKQLGIAQAALLIIIGDGASWIWKRVPELRAALGLEDMRVVEIVDWAHAAGKLMPPAKVGLQKEQQQWFKRMRTFLKQGEISQIIAALKALDGSHDPDNTIRAAIHYFQTHEARMQYKRFHAECFPIGSGVIESGVRRIVNLRLKGASIFWRPETAEAILYLRCHIKSGRWVTFVKSVLDQWAIDMSTSLMQAAHVRQTIATAVRALPPPGQTVHARQESITWARQVLEGGKTLIVDTETTGLHDNDEVVQLAIVDIQGTVLLDTLVRPTSPMAPEARAIHGITDQALADAPPFADLYHPIAHLLGHRPVLAYNADFDRRILAQTCTKYGLPPLEVAAWDCVMERYAYFWGERSQAGAYKPQSLSTACIQQGIGVHGHHEAVQDCLLTLALINAMAIAGEKEI